MNENNNHKHDTSSTTVQDSETQQFLKQVSNATAKAEVEELRPFQEVVLVENGLEEKEEEEENESTNKKQYPTDGSSVSSFISRQTPSLQQEAAATMELARKRLQHNRIASSSNSSAATSTITLDGLLGLNKLEHEATTHILRGLDEKTQKKNSDQAFDAATILPTMTQEVSDSILMDSISHSLQLQDFEGNSVTSAPAGTREDASASGALPSIQDYHHHHHHHDDDDDDGNNNNNHYLSRRDRSASTASEGRPLLNHSPKAHRRDMSVDDQLLGMAMDMFMLNQAASRGKEHASNAQRSVVLNPNDGALQEEVPLSASARDTFMTDANRLMGTHRRLFSAGGSELPPVIEGVDDTGRSSAVLDDGVVVDLESPPLSGSAIGGGSDETAQSSFRTTFKNEARKSHLFELFGGAADRFKEDLESWGSVFNPRTTGHALRYLCKAVAYLILPLIGIALLLYYVFDNPVPTANGGNGPSVSWWLLFVARQVITFIMALTLQKIVIDFLCVGTRIIPKILGPIFTLLIVQSKGWPFVLFAWSILDFGLLYGENKFAAHWGSMQDWYGIFNESNPSGDVVNNDWNRTVLLIAMIVPIAVALKRFGVGLFLGRQSYMHYGEPLAKVMGKMLLVSEVAALGKRSRSGNVGERTKMADKARSISLSVDDDIDQSRPTQDDGKAAAFDRNPFTGSIHNSQKIKIMHLLDRWEEPERVSQVQQSASIAAVLKFRNALTLIRNRYPFSYAFGLASTREECVISSQEVYKRLLKLSQNTDVLDFETMALIALMPNGVIDEQKAKDLVRVFRPNRDGSLTLLDFVKSVDAVYKEFRLLQASIENASQIDRAFERIINVIFYVLVIVIVMALLGFDPLSLFLSLSSVILAFAFMIGSASSKYFEGLLFILVRRPYGIGDLINVNGIDEMTGFMGSIGWTVQNVTLYETTMTWLPTLETATVANGALASSRIVNWARSPNARFVIFLYFPIETTYETIDLFRHAVEEYMKARPREWLAFNAFRVLAIHTDKGYMHLELVVQHREAWQNPGAIYDSRGNLVSYCNEVQKLLGMQYRAPPVPIDIRTGSVFPASLTSESEGGIALSPSNPATMDTVGNASNADAAGGEEARSSLNAKFRHAAENKHRMFY